MNFRELLKPNVSETDACHLVQLKYGMKVAEIQRMVSFNDQNFHIQVLKEHQNPNVDEISENGYTLKIINTMKSSLEGHFESMHSSMTHLNERGLRVPQPVRNLEGKTWSLEQVSLLNEGENVPEQKKCGVHLLTFLPGTPLTKIEPTPDIFYQWGALLAKFHHATKDLTCPSMRKKEIFYSLESIPEISNFAEDLDEGKKRIVYQVLERFRSKISANADTISKGFIHGDFNGHNILARSQEAAAAGCTVDGILDFEDMHHGPYAWDIGLMLAHSMLDCGRMVPFEAAGHALAGYLSGRHLSESDMNLIKVCIECRLCQSSVLCGYSRRLDPDNSYVSLLSDGGDLKWTRLEELLATSNGQLLERWNLISQHWRKE